MLKRQTVVGVLFICNIIQFEDQTMYNLVKLGLLKLVNNKI